VITIPLSTEGSIDRREHQTEGLHGAKRPIASPSVSSSIPSNTFKNNKFFNHDNDSSLTDKPRWEILLSSKLTDYGVKKEFHPAIIQKAGELIPFCLIMSFGVLAAIFSKKDK